METILITGTSSGLCRALAEFYTDRGYNVIGFSRTELTLPNYTHYNVDIKNELEVKEAFNSIDHIDVLINNAAVFNMNRFENSTIDTVDNIIDTNLKGQMYVTKHALNVIKTGKIIFINSVAGLEEIENQSIYCASKYGLTAFAGVLGKELQSRHIKVSSIHPGGINTPLWNNSNPYPGTDVSKTLDPTAIVNIVDLIVTDKYNIEYKTIKVFPEIEWHN